MINQAVKKIINSLENENIRYVHWKSNLRIEYALRGIDDLDLLIEEKDLARFIHVLEENKFYLVRSYSDNWQTGLMHFLGYSSHDRKIVHVHLHHRLPIGYDYNKNFYVSNIESILDRRRGYGKVQLSSIEDEYILLVLRIFLKNSLTAFLLRNPVKNIKILCGKSTDFIPKQMRNEYDDLHSRVSWQKVNQILINSYGFIDVDVFYSLKEKINENRYVEIVRGYFLLRNSILIQAPAVRLKSLGKSFSRLIVLRFRFAAKLLNIPPGKIPASGGKIFAFIGSDGSGKSTIMAESYAQLNTHFACKRLHFGKPHKKLNRLLVSGISTLLRSMKLFGLYEQFIAVSNAYARYRVMKTASKYRSNGYIVLIDRMYIPQINSMDCPRLQEMDENLMKQIERHFYKKLSKISLDDTIFLKVSLRNAHSRKPEEDVTKLSQRIQDVNMYLVNNEDRFVVDTDSNNVEESVSLVLENIWKNLI